MTNRNFNLLLFRISTSTTLALILTLISAALVLAHGPASTAAHPTRLIIPSISLDRTIIPVGLKPVVINGQNYATWEVARNYVGWHNRSAPLGQVGNTVLSGHSDAMARVFQNLKYVNVGDEIVAYSASHGQVRRYLVTDRILVREVGVPIETRIKNAQLIAPTPDERLTLVTCAKPGATHRLILIARPAP